MIVKTPGSQMGSPAAAEEGASIQPWTPHARLYVCNVHRVWCASETSLKGVMTGITWPFLSILHCAEWAKNRDCMVALFGSLFLWCVHYRWLQNASQDFPVFHYPCGLQTGRTCTVCASLCVFMWPNPTHLEWAPQNQTVDAENRVTCLQGDSTPGCECVLIFLRCAVQNDQTTAWSYYAALKIEARAQGISLFLCFSFSLYRFSALCV